jgi:phospholipase/carboxylesterase
MDFKGAILYSATLVNEEEWREKAKKKSFAFIQSHGKNDTILPYELAENLFDMLVESGWKGDFNPFSGGHEIPMKIISETSKFINLIK